MEYGYEVDFLPVGKESKSGGAIALRFGNMYGEGKPWKKRYGIALLMSETTQPLKC